MNETKKIKIAQIIGIVTDGGVESTWLNFFNHIDKERFQIDFFIENDGKLLNKEYIESNGGRVFYIPPYSKLGKFKKALLKIFKEEQYDIVHSNLNSLSVFPLKYAKKAGIKIRIAHSHSTSNKKEWKRNILKNILRKFSKKYATNYVACTPYAGEWLFGKKADVFILHNAFDLEKFYFNQTKRDELRKELHLEDKFVIGHVGRFMFQKNHEFIIDIFAEFIKKHPDTHLLLIGEGPLMENIKKKADAIGILDKITFLGTINNTNEMYNAMDAFIFPSFYEGLGMALIEAELNNLPSIASNYVPQDAFISNIASKIDLTNKEEWLNKLEDIYKNKDNRRSGEVSYEGSDIDIIAETKKLEEYYSSLLDKK